jgi:hypothetical protein
VFAHASVFQVGLIFGYEASRYYVSTDVFMKIARIGIMVIPDRQITKLSALYCANTMTILVLYWQQYLMYWHCQYQMIQSLLVEVFIILLVK